MTIENYKPSKGENILINRNNKIVFLVINRVTRNKVYACVNICKSNHPFKIGDILCINASEILYVLIYNGLFGGYQSIRR